MKFVSQEDLHNISFWFFCVFNWLQVSFVIAGFIIDVFALISIINGIYITLLSKAYTYTHNNGSKLQEQKCYNKVIPM